MCKEAINATFETTLHQGLETERQLFRATFATKDTKEGMCAFMKKKPPQYVDE